MNDIQDTAILAGALLDSNGPIAVVEAERRIADTWKFEIEGRWFLDVDPSESLLSGLRDDSFVTLRLSRYF